METDGNGFSVLTRREFLRAAVVGGLAAGIHGSGCIPRRKIFLVRYDTESWGGLDMTGFLAKLVTVHRQDQIPATLFCRGATLDGMRSEFRDFFSEVRDDPLFDLQDHSYSHVALGYSDGPSVEELEADYLRSFAVHEELFEKRPVGIAICGNGGLDGERLPGFDATEKSLAEFRMVAGLGVRMINAFLTGVDESNSFIHYGAIGYPEIMGFPSGYSDTEWMWQQTFGDPMEYILGQVDTKALRGEHFPLMLHDWVAWNHAPDRELSHVRTIAERARALGYELLTHAACCEEPDLWQTGQSRRNRRVRRT